MRIRIRISTLVRRALTEVCTVPVLLVIINVIIIIIIIIIFLNTPGSKDPRG